MLSAFEALLGAFVQFTMTGFPRVLWVQCSVWIKECKWS